MSQQQATTSHNQTSPRPSMSSLDDSHVFYRQHVDRRLALAWTRVLDPETTGRLKIVRFECGDGFYLHIHQDLIGAMSEKIRGMLIDAESTSERPIDGQEELTVFLPPGFTRRQLEAVDNLVYHGIVAVRSFDLGPFLELVNILGIKGFDQFVDDGSDDPDYDQSPGEAAASVSSSTEDHYDFTKLVTIKTPATPLSTSSCASSSSFGLPMFGSSQLFMERFSKTTIKRRLDYRSGHSGGRRLQGRRPQLGSPLITEEFKRGDRYLCRVCQRGYLWKKSLVRHYKDFHPGEVETVTEETSFD